MDISSFSTDLFPSKEPLLIAPSLTPGHGIRNTAWEGQDQAHKYSPSHTMNVTESKFLAKSCWGMPGQAAEEEEAAKGHQEVYVHPIVQPSKAQANEQLQTTRMDPISDAAPGKSN